MSKTEQGGSNVDNLIEKISNETETATSEVRDLVEEKYEMMKASQSSDMPDDRIHFFAAKNVNNELKNMTGSSFVGGSVEELPVLTLGFQQKDGDYFVTEDGYQALVGLGIVNPEDDPAGLSTFVIDGSHGVDIEYAKELFEPLNTIRVHATRRQVGSRDGENKLRKGNMPCYVCQSTNSTTLEEVNPEEEPSDSRFSELPDDWEEKRQMLNNNFFTDEETVNLQNYAEHVTDQTQSNNGNLFETAFGVDVKRIRGEVVDVFNNDTVGKITLVDDTVFDESDVPEDLQTDKTRIAGLECFDFQMADHLLRFDEGSILDVYGYIEQGDEGQYRMRPFGAVPIIEFERDPNTGASEDEVKEEVI